MLFNHASAPLAPKSTGLATWISGGIPWLVPISRCNDGTSDDHLRIPRDWSGLLA